MMLYANVLRGFEDYHALAREGFVAPLNVRGLRLFRYLRARRARCTLH